MGALVLKSKSSLNSSVEPLDFVLYKQRVLADGGVVTNEQAVRDAINFALSSGANESTVFSAVSPNWGIKKDGNKVLRLYSLFGSDGDCDHTGFMGITVNPQTNGLVFPGSAMYEMKTKKGVTPKASSSIIVSHKITPHSTYGTSKDFALAKLNQVNISSDSGYGAQLYYTRNSTTDMPPVWSAAMGIGGQGSTFVSNMGSVDNKLTLGGRITKQGTTLYKNGALIGSAADPSNSMNLGIDMQMIIGHSTSSETYAFEPNSPFLGEIYEVWYLVDADEKVVKTLSSRA